jgi:hypothetical protein
VVIPDRETKTYTAYVSKDKPTDGPPLDRFATSIRIAVTHIGDTGPVNLNDIDEFQYDHYVALLATVPLQDLCTPLAFVRQPGVSSVPPAYLACSAAVESGKNLRYILRVIATAGGLAALDRLVLEHPKHSDEDGDGRPVPPPINDIPIRDRFTPQPDQHAEPGHADVVAQRCRAYAARANLQLINGKKNPCTTLPIFSPGADVSEAAQHKSEVILARPWMMQLNYVPSSVKEQTFRVRWYTGPPIDPRCADKTADQDCDEYPYFSTDQGARVEDPWAASLKPVDSGHNRLEGTRYGQFLSEPTAAAPRGCGLQQDDPFLVVPTVPAGREPAWLPQPSGMFNTDWWCGRR